MHFVKGVGSRQNEAETKLVLGHVYERRHFALDKYVSAPRFVSAGYAAANSVRLFKLYDRETVGDRNGEAKAAPERRGRCRAAILPRVERCGT